MLLKDMLPTLLRGKMRREALKRYLLCPWANQEKVCRTEINITSKEQFYRLTFQMHPCIYLV